MSTIPYGTLQWLKAKDLETVLRGLGLLKAFNQLAQVLDQVLAKPVDRKKLLELLEPYDEGVDGVEIERARQFFQELLALDEASQGESIVLGFCGIGKHRQVQGDPYNSLGLLFQFMEAEGYDLGRLERLLAQARAEYLDTCRGSEPAREFYEFLYENGGDIQRAIRVVNAPED